MKAPMAPARSTAFKKACSLIPAAVMAISFMSTPVLAGTSITVAADRAKIVNITGEPAAVIIGNPTFADVTVRQGQIIIHGRHYGSTNLLILDERGDELANFELTVAQQPTQAVVMYKAGQRQSYSCAPNCQPTLSVGDSDDYFGKFVQSQISSKTKTAISAAKLSK